MGRVLPILFNGDMVRAILDGRKTVTRRAVKYKYSNTEMKMRTDKYGTCLIEIQKDIEGETNGKYPDGRTWHRLLPYIEKEAPYKKGDILYVRETWHKYTKRVGHGENCRLQEFYGYRASVVNSEDAGEKWHPSIHMPKLAARIWLKVTDVRVERLQESTSPIKYPHGKDNTIIREGFKRTYDFIDFWNSTIKKSDIGRYGWDANPWVWVIEFERCGKPEVKDA
ncbi:MAG TPA: hypothetical protein DCZ91_13405 [Lachnospiraceae bacterium]|nr:hypothetical protein [Lachnospiraceae bacterium]